MGFLRKKISERAPSRERVGLDRQENAAAGRPGEAAPKWPRCRSAQAREGPGAAAGSGAGSPGASPPLPSPPRALSPGPCSAPLCPAAQPPPGLAAFVRGSLLPRQVGRAGSSIPATSLLLGTAYSFIPLDLSGAEETALKSQITLIPR